MKRAPPCGEHPILGRYILENINQRFGLLRRVEVNRSTDSSRIELAGDIGFKSDQFFGRKHRIK